MWVFSFFPTCFLWGLFLFILVPGIEPKALQMLSVHPSLLNYIPTLSPSNKDLRFYVFDLETLTYFLEVFFYCPCICLLRVTITRMLALLLRSSTMHTFLDFQSYFAVPPGRIPQSLPCTNFKLHVSYCLFTLLFSSIIFFTATSPFGVFVSVLALFGTVLPSFEEELCFVWAPGITRRSSNRDRTAARATPLRALEAIMSFNIFLGVTVGLGTR